MNQIGEVDIHFETPIGLPSKIDQKYWDILLEVEVISINDGSKFKGLFF